MKLSTRGRYGARAMVDMALHEDQGPILLKDIAKRQGISEKYLEHIITSLLLLLNVLMTLNCVPV